MKINPGSLVAILKLRGGRRGVVLSMYAQFLAVCSSSIRTGTLSYAVSFSRLWRGKRRVFEQHKLVFMDQLPPSTNADKLSDPSLGGRCLLCPAPPVLWRWAKTPLPFPDSSDE